MNGRDLLQAFGFQHNREPRSIYPFSPVYRVDNEGKMLIVKQTQSPIEQARKLMDYTAALKNNGVNVVIPVDMDTENPKVFQEDIYVVYPFIEGSVYTGTDDEIYEAGKLLGQIHSMSSEDNEFALKAYDLYNFNRQEVEESVRRIEEHATRVNYEINSMRLKEALLQIITQQQDLKECGLPHVSTPHDYKANNLIYTPKPYLIDPDNAKWIPRIFDLALALLLFHNELSSAPDEMFTPEQWKTFVTGFKETVSLSDVEKVYWRRAIEHVFLDEVVWLMAEFEEDWINPAQLKLFDSLMGLLADSSLYPL